MARRRARMLVAAVAGISGLTALATPAAAEADAKVMPMTSVVRACDFSVSPHTWRTGYARAVALVRPAAAGSVPVEVQLQTAVPNTDYYVKVFQMPRGSADCAVAPIGVRTDAVGAATVTVNAPIDAGTTGIWVSVERPDPYSQQPAEVYTSDFIAAV